MRVLLAGMSNMLFQIITGVLAQTPENVVVGRVSEPAGMAAQIRSSHPDVVMMQATSPRDASAVWPLLYRFPTLKIVTIAGNGASGFVHELRPTTRALDELSADTLRDALRVAPGRMAN